MTSPPPSLQIPRLPMELHTQIISYLTFKEQVHAGVNVCRGWRHFILNSQSMRRSRYSNERVAKGIHLLIAETSEAFRFVVKGDAREYYHSGKRLDDGCPFLDEPFFSPSAWNGEDPELAVSLNNTEFDMFTSFPGFPRLTWWGTDHWGKDVTVRQFMEMMLKPIFEAPRAEGESFDGTLSFFLAVQLIASAFSLTYPRPSPTPSAQNVTGVGGESGPATASAG